MVSDSDMFYFFVGLALIVLTLIFGIINEIMIARGERKSLEYAREVWEIQEAEYLKQQEHNNN